ncbi:MAG: bifunctional ADP-dependent NAD(P)H-hydrate dehydratase/NAD(P)H-hydrate epimerase [Thermoproteota archaeon]|nr:MAG: bifunctional ADP-dependent NAD(P)H-hydrate dehydratase/NAD(P)H-hydrate epimerase [Candidatus Korarchaeota archaeon]
MVSLREENFNSLASFQIEPKTREDFIILEENSEWLGVTKLLLMENAGAAVARNALKILGSSKGKRILVFCGRGNNGGDGLVAARHLVGTGADVKVFLIGGEPKAKEALYNYNIMRRCDLSVDVQLIRSKDQLSKITGADLIIDALLGTGTKGAPRGLIADAIEFINSLNVPVLSIDTPSGLDPFTGEVEGTSVKANVTVTFHSMKPGLRGDLCGKIVVEKIGAPPEALLVSGPGDVKVVIKKRDPWSHKGDFGRILIVGGSSRYSGAPALAGLAALRSGADLVMIMGPEKAIMPIKSTSPDLIAIPLSSEEELVKEDVPMILDEANRSDVVLMGPGLGRSPETKEALSALLETLKERRKKVVLDADALKLIKPEMGWPELIITPHSSEFSKIFGKKPSLIVEDRIKLALWGSGQLKGTVLLKGHVDIIASLGNRFKINVTGNPGMTVGGTGDVLSGVVSSLYAIHKDPIRASSAAAYIVGRAGDLAYKDIGYSLIASDLLKYIPKVILECVGS